MSRYFARIVRALIVSLFGFGGGIGLMVLIGNVVILHNPRAFEHALYAGVGIGTVFAVLLVGVLLPLDLTAHLFLSKGRYSEIWELEQTRELVFDGTLKDLTRNCRQALLVVPAVKSVSEDMEHLMIRALTGASWRSSGEQIEVEINPVSENSWRLRCTSKPMSHNIVFDYAKNFENVETWLARMNAQKNGSEQAA